MRRVRRPLGPAVIDLKGATLADDERARLAHPAVGGVILFSRNFESADQVRALAGEIKRVREPELLVCVDQEGGRVQRFREGFTLVPPMRRLGALWDRNREAAREAARGVGL